MQAGGNEDLSTALFYSHSLVMVFLGNLAPHRRPRLAGSAPPLLDANSAMTFWSLIRIFLIAPFLCYLSKAESSTAGGAEGENQDYIARFWMTGDGAPYNTVTTILQDHTGYIWVGTTGGLARFDGRQFKTINFPPELRRRGLTIRGMAEEPNAGLLVLLPSGEVVRVNHDAVSVHPLTESLRSDSPSDLFVEPNGTIWVGTLSGALFRWQDGQIRSFGKSEGIERRIPSFSFALDREGRTWVATGTFLGYYKDGALVPFRRPPGKRILIAPSLVGGIWILADARLYQMEGSELRALPSMPEELPPNASPRHLFEDRNHALWIATRHNGVFRYSQGELKHVDFACDSALYITQDREGDMWVGTEGCGASMLRPKFFSLFDQKTGLAEKFCSGVAADLAGDIWVANREDGVVRFHQGQRQSAPPNDKLKANTLTVSPTGEIWVGATDGLYRLASDQKAAPVRIETPLTDIRSVFCARNGDTWFSSYSHQLGYIHGERCYIFSTKDGYIPERITGFAEGLDGTIWIGSASGRLRQIRDQRVTVIAPPSTFNLAPINGLYVDRGGLLWLATADGLVLFDGHNYRRFTEAQGLLDSLLLQIQEDDLGHLWLAARQGFYRVARDQLLDLAKGKRAKVDAMMLRKEDGVPSLSPLGGSHPLSVKDRSGKLWFATLQGVLGIDPGKVSTPSLHPPVVLEEIQIDGASVDQTVQPFRVSPGRHHLKFQFSALSFAATEKIRLWYHLEGIDPSWVETGSTRSAEYSSLPPRDYRLRVVASEETPADDNPGDVFLDFTVVPAWWQTLWARTGALVLLTGASVWGLRRYSHWQLQRQLERLKQEQALEKERARIARDLHDELGGSLTRIAFGVDQLKRGLGGSETSALVEQLGQRVRRHASDLQRVVWVESAKNDSLDRVAFFIGRFAQDYFRDSPINCVVRDATEIPHHPISPDVQHNLVAIAKEAFNNVLKHSRATQVMVEIGFNRGVFEVKIKDNGVGFMTQAEPDENHNGLANMRARVAELKGTLQIEGNPGNGTTVAMQWTYGYEP